ncbi:MAG: PP2C family protein-serine/threonine phosphatase [Anaerolineales bacterium]
MTEEIVRNVPFFASLPDSELEQLSAALEPKEVAAEALLLSEDEQGDHYYILVEGEVEVLKALGTPDERLLGVRKPYSFIGEMSLFSEDGKNTASVRARTPLKLLEMSHSDLDELLHRQPSFSYEMIRMMSRRLDESENLTIVELRQKNAELTEANEELRAAQVQIIEKERLEKELDVARDIQRSILPNELPQMPNLDLGAAIYPMTAVGGDFYDFIPLGKERIGIAVGDVTDHGVPAALFMALTATLLRVISAQLESPSAVLKEVNRLLLEMSESGMLVTLLYGVLDRRKNTFRYARAGHELPLVLDPKEQWVAVDSDPGQPLGFFEDPLLDEQVITIPQGGHLIVYTDGVLNTLNRQDQMFGVDNLKSAVSTSSTRSGQGICDHVLKSLHDFRGETPPYDDITLVVVKLT